MRIAIVGCGYVANFYLKTLALYPELQLLGVIDRDQDRVAKFAAHYAVPQYRSLDELLADPQVDLVVNLTNPGSHFAVSKACLEAGKHVYSEKPLALSMVDARELVAIAAKNGVHIASAPSRILAETAQTMWKALREKVIGNPYLVYAEMDDGLLHRMPYKKWNNELGTPWPYQDEFETGCTLEHAGYVVSLLTAFFGPIKTVTATASVRVPDKETDVALAVQAPDFSLACLQFASGMVARITCSIVAPADHSIRIFGSDGILCTDDIWHPRSPVYIRRSIRIRRRTIPLSWKRRYPLVGPPAALARAQVRRLNGKKVDYCLGIVELAAAIEQQRPCRLSADYCLHHDEVVLAIHNATENGSVYHVTTTFNPIDPMPWAK
ncbi:MAG: Gfo/Idh/MocA family oxidoreductase [Planctomycetota bacterium]|nr:Gfo/Idh/MocA family oxidoreductase [Planctomycetota bacterium]